MTNTELLKQLQQELRKLHATYENHAMIERIIQVYMDKVSKESKSVSKEKENS